METVRAIWLTEFGAPSVLVPGEAPDPEPGEGQVLVDVEAASVLFAEMPARAGRSMAPSRCLLRRSCPATVSAGTLLRV